MPNGSPQKYATTKTASSFGPIFVGNGVPMSITVAACEQAACVLPSVNTLQTTRTTMIDATPPSGTVSLDDGALATNNRTVTLGLAATDPLIAGLPGTSSGVTQFAVDEDGNGTFPCSPLLNGDTSGCAQAFAPTGTATVPAGDGAKTVGVQYGDGARAPAVPCTPPFCAIFLGNPILGNVSTAAATDTILLDTVKPVAVATQDRSAVDRGGSVAFDSATSTDTSPTATPSGIDPAATTWDFRDGTPPVTAAKVAHVFAAAGTFVGQLRVKDRAGNLSDPRSFTVTVNTSGGATAGGGSIAGISGTAGFSISRLRVTARYVRSRLKGSVAISGSSTLAGGFRAELRRTARGKLLRTLATTVTAAPFATTLTLPPTLLPGRYRLSFVGPGGTLTTTLTLTPPRVGVISAARVTASRARFTFAARPVVALRRKLTVRWSQKGRDLGVTRATGARVVTAPLPAGAHPGRGRLTATLRAGGTVVGSGGVRLR